MMPISYSLFSKLYKMMALGLFLVSTSSFASENACGGTSTTIYSDNNAALTICHGAEFSYDTSHVEQWQDCTDALIYIENKRLGKTVEYADCLPTEQKQVRLDRNKFMVRHYYTTYPGFESEPLLVETLDLNTNVKTYRFEKHFPACTETEIDEAAKRIDETVAKPFDGKTYFDSIYGSFYKLRDCAQSDPKKVLSLLKTYKQQGNFDGEVAETLSSVIDEAELIEEGQQK